MTSASWTRRDLLCGLGASLGLACAGRGAGEPAPPPRPPAARRTRTDPRREQLEALASLGFRLGRDAVGEARRPLPPVGTGRINPCGAQVVVAPDWSLVEAHQDRLRAISPLGTLAVLAPTDTLQPVAGFANLCGLWVVSRSEDFTPVGTLSSLFELYFMPGSLVLDLSSVGAQRALRELVLCCRVGERGGTARLRGLGSLKALEVLEATAVAEQPALDLTGLHDLQRSAVAVRLNGFTIPDLRPLVGLSEQTTVVLARCRLPALRDLVGVRACVVLEDIPAGADELAELHRLDPRTCVFSRGGAQPRASAG